jgi:hypothetical protein
MKSNPKTGELILPSGTILSSQSTHSTFLSSIEGKRAEVNIRNEPLCSFSFTDDEDSLGIIVFFKGEILESVHFFVSDPQFGVRWENWSRKKESERNQANHQWLKKNGLGSGKRYSWGSVWSGYDPKSGSSSIVIRYTRPDLIT